MFRRSLALLALGVLALVASANAAAAQCCSCALPCAGPAPVTIWGLSPVYTVNQGPVFSGPGYTTLPTYEGEGSTADYPYVGYEGGYGPYPGYPSYRPYADPFSHHVYRGYWHGVAPGYRHAFYRHVAVPRVLTVSAAPHSMPHVHRIDHDWRDR